MYFHVLLFYFLQFSFPCPFCRWLTAVTAVCWEPVTHSKISGTGELVAASSEDPLQVLFLAFCLQVKPAPARSCSFPFFFLFLHLFLAPAHPTPARSWPVPSARFSSCCHSLRKVLVFVIAKPPEWSYLHTAYSVGLIFNEKDSLVSWLRYLICVLVESPEGCKEHRRDLLLGVSVAGGPAGWGLCHSWAGLWEGVCHALRNTGLKLAQLFFLELAKIAWSQRWDQAWRISVFEEAVKMRSGRWGALKGSLCK